MYNVVSDEDVRTARLATCAFKVLFIIGAADFRSIT